MSIKKSVIAVACILSVGSAVALEAKMTGGAFHALFIDAGNVYGMGNNANGELNSTSMAESRTPVFTGITGAKSIAGSLHRTAVLGFDGKVSFSGRKLPGTPNPGKAPFFLPTSLVVSDIAMTNTDAFFISGGLLYRWNFVDASPVQVTTSGSITSIAAGTAHLVALFSDGTVGSYGTGSSGQLGTGGTSPSTEVVKMTVSGVTSIAAGANSTFMVKSDGTVLATGANNMNSLGFVDGQMKLVPTVVPNLSNVKKILPGTNGTIAVLISGAIAATGSHNYIAGALYNVSTEFVLIPGVSGVVDAARPGDFNVVDKGTSGVKYGWGGNLYGKLGDGTNTERHEMTQSSFVSVPSSEPVPEVQVPEVLVASVVLTEPVPQEAPAAVPEAPSLAIANPLQTMPLTPVTMPEPEPLVTSVLTSFVASAANVVDAVIETVSPVVSAVVTSVSNVVEAVKTAVSPTAKAAKEKAAKEKAAKEKAAKEKAAKEKAAKEKCEVTKMKINDSRKSTNTPNSCNATVMVTSANAPSGSTLKVVGNTKK